VHFSVLFVLQTEAILHRKRIVRTERSQKAAAKRAFTDPSAPATVHRYEPTADKPEARATGAALALCSQRVIGFVTLFETQVISCESPVVQTGVKKGSG
jgi:hypothetical protein